jgi:phosphopentomutase
MPAKFAIILQPNDIVFIVADHGCDPTLPGSDHTREYIPIVMFGQKIKGGCIGPRQTFADVGQTIANYFNIPALKAGQAF